MVCTQKKMVHKGAAWCFMRQTSHAEAIPEMRGQLPRSYMMVNSTSMLAVSLQTAFAFGRQSQCGGPPQPMTSVCSRPKHSEKCQGPFSSLYCLGH